MDALHTRRDWRALFVCVLSVAVARTARERSIGCASLFFCAMRYIAFVARNREHCLAEQLLRCLVGSGRKLGLSRLAFCFVVFLCLGGSCSRPNNVALPARASRGRNLHTGYGQPCRPCADKTVKRPTLPAQLLAWTAPFAQGLAVAPAVFTLPGVCFGR